MSDRQLATIQKIKNIENIEGKDKIGLASFYSTGWKVIVDKSEFAKVYTNGYSIAWSNELEIDATTIYSELTGKNFGEILSPKLSHATN